MNIHQDDHDFKLSIQHTLAGYRSPHSHGSNGSAGMSKLMGISNSILSRKANPNDETAFCSPGQVVALCNVSGDLSVMHAMAARVGCLLMPIESQHIGDMSPDLAANFKELGEWLQAAAAAHAAPAITDSTFAELQREMVEGLTATIATFSRLKAKHAAGKPGHLKAAA